MRYWLKVFGLFVILKIIVISPVYAKDEKIRYCSDFYAGVKRVFLIYEQKLPLKAADWARVAKLSTREANKILSDAGMPVIFLKNHIPPASMMEKDVLYIKINYSFVSRDAFSIKPSHDLIAIWAEEYRVNPTNGFTSLQSHKRFSDWQDIEEMFLSSASSRLLADISCNIIQGALNKYCSNRNDYNNNLVVSFNSACVPTDKDFKELEKLILDRK